MLIHQKHKLNKIVSGDETRKSIQHIHLQNGRACATNSIVAALVPVQIEENKHDVPKQITAKAWEEMLKLEEHKPMAQCELNQEYLKAGNAHYFHPTDEKELFPENESPIYNLVSHRLDELRNRTSNIIICLNVDELYKLSKAMGTARLCIITDEELTQNKSFLVLPADTEDNMPIGMIAPIRIDFENTNLPNLNDINKQLYDETIQMKFGDAND